LLLSSQFPTVNKLTTDGNKYKTILMFILNAVGFQGFGVLPAVGPC